tara:strand:+ start:1831 stop:4074 length:2244 start_codon:yes stop_codon:yes gene_type:complete
MAKIDDLDDLIAAELAELGMESDVPQEQPQEESRLDTARQAIGQGTLLGFGDEAVGALRGIGAGLTSDQSFKDAINAAIDDERRINREYEERNPYKSLALQLGGGLLTGGVGAGRVGAFKAGERLRRRMGRGALAGLGTGAIAGTGMGEGNVLTGEGAMARALSGAEGAAGGAVLGGLLPAGFSLARRTPVISTAVKARALPFTDKYAAYKKSLYDDDAVQEADELIARTLDAEDVTAQTLQNQAARQSANVGEDIATPVDASVGNFAVPSQPISRVQDTANVGLGGQSTPAVSARLAERTADQGNRVTRHIETNVSSKKAYGDGDEIGEIDRLNLKRSEEAEKDYKGVMDEEIVPNAELEKLLKKSGILQGATSYARRMFGLENIPGFKENLSAKISDKDLLLLDNLQGPAKKQLREILEKDAKEAVGPITVRRLEYVKWGLDKEISRLETAPYDSANELRALVEFKDKFVAALDDSSSSDALRLARAAYSKTSKEIEDISLGMRLTKTRSPADVEELSRLRATSGKKPKQIANDVAKLERIRIGVANGLKEKVNKAGRETNKVKAVDANADDRRFLSAIFPDDPASNQTVQNLLEKLDAEDVIYNVDKSGMSRTGTVPGQDANTLLSNLADTGMARDAAAAGAGSRYGLARMGSRMLSALTPDLGPSRATQDMAVAKNVAERLYTPVFRAPEVGPMPRSSLLPQAQGFRKPNPMYDALLSGASGTQGVDTYDNLGVVPNWLYRTQ